MQQEKYLDEEALPEDPIQVISKNTSDEKSKTGLIKNTIDPGFYVQHTARGDLESVLADPTWIPSTSKQHHI
ncbi:MAG: hypothetical protein CM15mP58_21770 [Burkholderiaceae bacterium]|nr:MAG: hypothetical protein CM15mP58_21770 [Burkholderiaceae bacterium]